MPPGKEVGRGRRANFYWKAWSEPCSLGFDGFVWCWCPEKSGRQLQRCRVSNSLPFGKSRKSCFFLFFFFVFFLSFFFCLLGNVCMGTNETCCRNVLESNRALICSRSPLLSQWRIARGLNVFFSSFSAAPSLAGGIFDQGRGVSWQSGCSAYGLGS